MVNCDSHVMPKFFHLVYVVLLLNGGGRGGRGASALVLRAYVSQHGLHGELEFTQRNDSLARITIRTNLQPTLQFPDHVLRWAVHEFPVDYRDLSPERCSLDNLGKELIDLTEELGFLIVPGKDHAEFESKNSLTGPDGLWGKSIRFESAEKKVICASIVSTDRFHESFAEATFSSPVAGIINFRWLSAGESDGVDSYVQTDLYHIGADHDEADYTRHKWKIFVTDIFDSDRIGHEDNCNALQSVFDPENGKDGMSVGDLDGRLGLVRVARDPRVRSTKTLFKHEVLNTLRGDMQTTRRGLYVVLYDHRREDAFLACAKLRLMPPQSAKVLIGMDGIRGAVEFTQRSPYEPSWASFQLGAADREYEADLRFVSSVLGYSVRELPPRPLGLAAAADDAAADRLCNTTGGLYNPTGVDLAAVPPPGLGSQEQYAVGDLLGKYEGRTPHLPHQYLLPGLARELRGAYWDVFLPLTGRHSVRHRALLVHRRAPKRDVCGTVMPYEWGTEYQTPMTTAQAVFRYPLVGRVLLRQPRDRPWEDTTVIVETMIHADGSNVNDTHGHRWAIHEHAPGADFYNWSRRCESAGAQWEPRPLRAELRAELQDGRHCARAPLCSLGDLTSRHGTLSVAGRKRHAAALTRRLFSQPAPALALAGRYSVLRRSLLILDDHGPVARGERMACSIITGVAPRKAVVHDWYGGGGGGGGPGRLELTQQSEYDVTNLHLKLDDIHGLHNYKIHIAPVEKDLEFPCERSTLLDTYNPLHVNRSASPPPAQGTPDQYEMGALGDKFGLLAGLRRASVVGNDTQLALFGRLSVLGRSLVLHQDQKGKSGRGGFVCGAVERGYSPAEARERRAVASFHHPGGFARGYVRMTQLVSAGGGASDTVLEVNLKYPGLRDRNLTHGHRWEVFVNPVGVDAAVAAVATRCVAGGYRWNPYFTQLADPLNRELYEQECGADNPLRCDVGDLTSRLGHISIGGDRQVFTDSNLPLEGDASALGRSLVLFAAGGAGERLACANIEPDNDIVKYVNIMKPPRFAIGQFLAEVRLVLGAPAWLLWAEARRSRPLHHGACLQLLMHFAGPQANRLEQDFTRLLASGRLDAPSMAVPGWVDTKRKRTTSYRQCGVRDPSDKKSTGPPARAARAAATTRRGSLLALVPAFIFLFIV